MVYSGDGGMGSVISGMFCLSTVAVKLYSIVVVKFGVGDVSPSYSEKFSREWVFGASNI